MDAIESRISEAPETAAPAAAPAGTNPWANDPAKAAAWAKLSPQVQKKLGMADPTDNIIVSRMVKGGFLSGAPVTDANPDGTPKAAPQAANPAPAAPAAQSPEQLAAAQKANGVDPARGNVTMPDGTNPESGTKTAVAPATDAASLKAAQDAAGNTSGTTTEPLAEPPTAQKTLLPVDPNIKAFQDEVLKTDPAAFSKFGADGRKGTEVNNAIAKYPQIASKYKLAPATPGTKGAPQAANPAPGAGTKEIPPEILQKFPSPKQGQEVWHKGTRYKYTITGGGRGSPATGRWAPTFQKGDWGWNQNQANARSGYSDPAFAAPQAANPVKEGVIAKALIESFGYTK